ncbi:glycosyltransferase family 61 protein [uncultured Tateyamaria sp.]|uniref:glycosyltransferase family 61 protein n=1 Tax=uncultured Tateyamaria sp. TaxID=455651 RepID=UPI002637432B|nr:glycosyltransferase family 61 protein [uncultured Tateyamaria sp.]
MVRAALVMPNMVEGDDTPHGVFDRRGSFLPLSQARLSRGRVSAAPPLEPAVDHLPGTHLYAGFGHTHFGHFMLESLVRLWALDHLETPPDGLVVPTRAHMHMEPVLSGILTPVVDRFCDGIPLRIIRTPTQIDRLVLPTPGFGHGPWLTGTPEFRAYTQKRFAQIKVDGPEKLYVSRTGLKRDHQRVDREDEIEAMMEEAGYFVFHPQKHPLETQLGVIRAARSIVGSDGSAFHLAPFAMRSDARAAIFMRRNRREMLSYLSTQMQSFAGPKPVVIDPRQRPLTGETPAPLCVDTLRTALSENGFL